MTADDLKSYQAVICAPVRGNYRGYDIVRCRCRHPAARCCWNAEHPRRISDVRHQQGAVPSLHVMIEAMKRAYADRARYLGDPAFVNAPTQLLLTKDYAARQRATSIRRARRPRPMCCKSFRSAKAATPRIIRWSTPGATRSAIPTH